MVAKMAQWMPRRRAGSYRWLRERKRYQRWGDNEDVAASVTVPAASLFNASAYTPGDYLQFYRDPRTRADYLQWAPFLLRAEDWYAKGGDND